MIMIMMIMIIMIKIIMMNESNDDYGDEAVKISMKMMMI